MATKSSVVAVYDTHDKAEAPVRARICEGLSFRGIELNKSRNAETAGVISTDASRAAVRVIRTDEEQMIARSDCRVLGLGRTCEKRNFDRAMKYISRLDLFSVGGVPPSEATPAGAI